jgi:hypothetical protein
MSARVCDKTAQELQRDCTHSSLLQFVDRAVQFVDRAPLQFAARPHLLR